MTNRGRIVEINFEENTVKIKLGRKATLKLQEQCYKRENVCVAIKNPPSLGEDK